MNKVSIRELRNSGGEIVDRVMAGECFTVTRAGRPVAELHPLPRPALAAATLLERWKHLPILDPEQFRQEIDELIDPQL